MGKRKANEMTADAGENTGIRRSSRRTNAAATRSESPAKSIATAKGRAIKVNAAAPENGDGASAFTVSPGESAGQQYWLMKAEPESRIEKGKDMKFSIDDLASKSVPEPWDGIRNYVARNNLRAMKKGDLAFFYHSNCKIPGIVGMMEIVEEYSPDLTARDPQEPYFDPKDKGDEPRWSVVHVEFRRKFDKQITLSELKEWNNKGQPLEHMQMLKSARLSVSRVSKDEWQFLVGVVEGQNAVTDSQED